MNKDTQTEMAKLLEEMSTSALAMQKVVQNVSACECGNTDWAEKAQNNRERFGRQNYDLLLLHMHERLGDLTRAFLKGPEDSFDLWKFEEELSEVMAIGIELQAMIKEDKFDKDD